MIVLINLEGINSSTAQIYVENFVQNRVQVLMTAKKFFKLQIVIFFVEVVLSRFVFLLMSPERKVFGQNRRFKNISGFFRFVSVEAEAAGKRPQEKKRGSRDFPSLPPSLR